MHESEANWVIGSPDELPAGVWARFSEARAAVSARSAIPWSEHCTECASPACYATCDLYQARRDGRCRRFEDGMVRIPFSGGVNPYIVRITFKRWAKLWATARANVYPITDADRHELRDVQLASWLHKVPIKQAQLLLIRKRYSWKKRMALRRVTGGVTPNCLLLECYNPGEEPVALTFTARVKDSNLPFQAQLIMVPGFNRHRIGVEQIATFVDLNLPLDLDLAPNHVEGTCTLYFGALDFVKDDAYAVPDETSEDNHQKTRICKCVVWDLDNTLWDGTLVEDGLERLTLKPGIAEILKGLDERGILISAASKNNYEDAMGALRRFGIDEYFLSPQISWSPKSEGLSAISAELNIGMDSLLFIDDSEFERAQVNSQTPEVAVLDARQYQEVLERPDTRVPVTEDGRRRRKSYRDQQAREGLRKSFVGEYEDFLRSCGLQLTLRSLTEANLERVHELTQRTNQMNFSGHLYTREQLRAIAADPAMQKNEMDCEDRFGNYGTVGFSIVSPAERLMTDLMFSCRIQGKRVEHAFLNYLLRKYRKGNSQPFFADYRKTPRNAPSGKVFDDLGFISDGENNGTSRLRFPESREPAKEGIVQIKEIAEVPLAMVEVEKGMTPGGAACTAK